MASRRNVEFRMSARDDTARGVRSVQRRFRGLGRSIASVFAGNVLARGFEEAVRGVAQAFRRILGSRLEGAFDPVAEQWRRIRGETEEAIERSREYRRVVESLSSVLEQLGGDVADGFEGVVVETDKFLTDGKTALELFKEAAVAAGTLSEEFDARSPAQRRRELEQQADAVERQGEALIRNTRQRLRAARQARQQEEALLEDLRLIAAEEERRARARDVSGGDDRNQDIRRSLAGFAAEERKGPAGQLLDDLQTRKVQNATTRVRERLAGGEPQTAQQTLQSQLRVAQDTLEEIRRLRRSGGFQ